MTFAMVRLQQQEDVCESESGGRGRVEMKMTRTDHPDICRQNNPDRNARDAVAAHRKGYFYMSPVPRLTSKLESAGQEYGVVGGDAADELSRLNDKRSLKVFMK
ncbi:hypothetical protein ACWY4P_48780 [Streptomyces sp. LZ34]